jgi:hypothetical protein
MSKKKQYLLFAVFIVLVLVVWILALPSISMRFLDYNPSEYWDLSDIVDYLEIGFPEKASNIAYEVGPNHNFYIHLKFQALPDTALAFAESLCDGILHSNYDPFHAIDSLSAIPEAYLIRVWPWYYSYSTNAADMAGNRCYAPRGHDQQVVVDKSHPDLYSVQYELSPGCGYDARRMPCYSPYAGVDRARISRFPYDIMGFTSSDSDTPTYTVVAQELCFLRSMFFSPQDGDAFNGSTVEVNVDSVEMPNGYISENGAFLVGNRDEQPATQDSTYCLPNEWSSGSHLLTINVKTLEGSERHFEWRFNVE